MGQPVTLPRKPTAQQVKAVQEDRDNCEYVQVNDGLDKEIQSHPNEKKWTYWHKTAEPVMTSNKQQQRFVSEYTKRGFSVPAPEGWHRQWDVMPRTSSQFESGMRMHGLLVSVELPPDAV
jgi:hypothetical protein